MTRDARPSLACRPRSVAFGACLALLTACAGMLPRDEAPDSGMLLRDSLPVAAAALDAGQFDVARRLYASLAERFTGAPEPVLGLGHVAFFTGRYAEAKRRFRHVAALAVADPTLRSEALIGAGRSAIAQGRAGEARVFFRRARDLGPVVPPAAAAWVGNGLAVADTMDGDYSSARAHYEEAIRLSSGDPWITANLVRMLVASGRIDEARRLLAAHPSSFWPGDDGAALTRLVEARRPWRLGPGEARAAPAQAVSTSERASIGPAAPERSRSGGPELASPSSPPLHPGLVLRLFEWGPSPPLPRAFEGLGGPNASALALRFADWSAPETTPAWNGLVRQASPTPPASEPPASTTLRPDHPAQGSATAPRSPSSPPGSATPDRSSPQILHLTLGQSRRLLTERAASAVSVAAPEVADVQLLAPNVLYVIARGVGRTSLAVLVDDEWSEERLVAVTLDLEPLRASLAADRDLREVRARPLARGVALDGAVKSAEIADRALRLATDTLPEGVSIENALRIAGSQQVNLEVQIAEVNRSVTESLGVNWEAFRLRDGTGLGFRIGRVLTAPGGVPTGIVPTVVDGQLSPSLYLGRSSGRTMIGAMVDALATAGLANVLARPNVTAVSGEPASFFSGGEFPLPTGFDNGVLAFEYKKYGVLLDFVPTVVDAGRIVLTVRPEVSEPSTSRSVTVAAGVAVPVINVRRAETTVEVGDGQSIVIAGLFRNRTNTVESGVPGLKDIPFLGTLFGQTLHRSDEVELIVIVTARLVQANAAPESEGASATEGRRQADGYYF